jgi:hypothetical protein
MRKPIVPTLIALLGALSTCLVLAATAGATTPSISHFQFSGEGVDPGASAACGFPITDTFTDTGTSQVLFDSQGNPIRVQVITSSTGTVTANGITLLARGQDNLFFDITDQTVIEVGLPGMTYLPGLGVVIQDVGRLVWSFEAFFNGGSPLVEDGPHPQLAGNIGALCRALTP